MKIVSTVTQIRECVRTARQAHKRIGLVPTMGALHAGHGALIEQAVRECGFVVASLFVNPAQFGPSEDFSNYPRTVEQDTAFCDQRGVAVLFTPSAEQMYPKPQQTWVEVEKLTDNLCGAARPGHFRGVATVCAKLFNIVLPDVAYFGQKDAQQVGVIQRMVDDLNFPLEIVVCPIVREPDGLAMSSRNRYLSAEERSRAVCLHQALQHCRRKTAQGCRDAGQLVEQMREIINKAGGRIDYVSIVDAKTLEPIQEVKTQALVALAVFIGSTRLIDNCLLDLKSPEK